MPKFGPPKGRSGWLSAPVVCIARSTDARVGEPKRLERAGEPKRLERAGEPKSTRRRVGLPSDRPGLPSAAPPAVHPCNGNAGRIL